MKKIIINPQIRHGKPVIEGTRITIEEVLGMLEGGMTYKEIEEEYGLTKDDIVAVINYISSLIKGNEVYQLQE